MLPVTETISKAIDMVLNAVDSVHTRRAYSRALTDFITWHQSTGQVGMTKAVVMEYIAFMRYAGMTPASINQRLSAIRRLASEAADNGLLADGHAQAISRAKGVKQQGARLGNWLTKEQAQELLRLPDTRTLKGLRDRAILSILLGCGLRREECAALTVGQIQQREGRWVLVDIEGKGARVRSVPMPSWAWVAVNEWLTAARIEDGLVFRALWKDGTFRREAMTSQAIYNMVVEYAERLGVNVRPHDLRRSFAKLAHKGDAALEQIQFSLGHSSVKTTERYVGAEQALHDAPCDRLGLGL